MIEINTWLNTFLQALQDTFGERLWLVGLQGSYGRGEATESSDIDLVVILDALTLEDIRQYNALLDTMSDREKICGFLSGKSELLNWEASDLYEVYYDTTSLKGTLDELLDLIDNDAVNRAIKIGVCNLYHGCVHNMLYEKDSAVLRGLYKSASFVIQAICYQQTGRYLKHQGDLLCSVTGDEKVILQTFQDLKNGVPVEFEPMSSALFQWCQKWIRQSNFSNE